MMRGWKRLSATMTWAVAGAPLAAPRVIHAITRSGAGAIETGQRAVLCAGFEFVDRDDAFTRFTGRTAVGGFWMIRARRPMVPSGGSRAMG